MVVPPAMPGKGAAMPDMKTCATFIGRILLVLAALAISVLCWLLLRESPTLAWPVVVLSLGLLYRDEVRGYLKRVTKIILPGGAGIEIPRLPSEEPKQPTGSSENRLDSSPSSSPSLSEETAAAGTGRVQPAERRIGHTVNPDVPVKWSNSANLYWLGYNIFGVFHDLSVGQDKGKLLSQLHDCKLHLDQLKFGDPEPGKLLDALITAVRSMPAMALDVAARRSLLTEVSHFRDLVGAYMEKHQRDTFPGTS